MLNFCTCLEQALKRIQYDMMTSPITNSTYHTHVLELVDAYYSRLLNGTDPESIPFPLLPPLTPDFTTLTPDESITSLLATTSPWIDVGSPDSVVAHVSLQVLNQEIAYAAFCGVNNVIIDGPQKASNVSQYARAIASALGSGPYLQLHIALPMDGRTSKDSGSESTHLASRVRPIFVGEAQDQHQDWLASWDAWELIRSVCKYHTRLSVGMLNDLVLFHFLCHEFHCSYLHIHNK